MNRILYHNRCRCKEKFSITKKPNLTIKGTRRRVGKKLLEYPKPNETRSKTFQMRV
jgi:predicted GTPase